MTRPQHLEILVVLLLGGWGLETLHAEASRDAWLRYAPLESAVRSKYESLPASVVVLGNSAVLRTAQGEMIRGLKGMTGKTLDAGRGVRERAIVLGTLATIHAAAPGLAPPNPLGAGRSLRRVRVPEQSGTRRTCFSAPRIAATLRGASLGGSMGQLEWHHRAWIRGPFHLL